MICGVRALSSQTLEAAIRLVGQQDKKQQRQDSCIQLHTDSYYLIELNQVLCALPYFYSKKMLHPTLMTFL